MTDVDLLLARKGLPTIDAILKLYLDYQRNIEPESRPGEYRKIASGSDAYKRTLRFLDSIGIKASDVMKMDGQHGILLEPDLASELFERITRIVEDVDYLVSLGATEQTQITMVMAASQLLGTRPLPHWLREFYKQYNDNKMSTGLDKIVPRIAMTYSEPYDLATEVLHDPHVDIVLTYCSIRRKFDAEQLARVPLHRCMLVRMDHALALRKREFEAINGFSLEYLKGTRVALLSDSRVIPDLPTQEIRRLANVVSVRTTLEAHAHVRAGSADLTFSHRELLSEGENKYLTVIDLSNNRNIGECDLVLLRGRGLPDSDLTNRGKIGGMLAKHIAMQMEDMKTRYSDAGVLTRELSRFKYAYHTSDIYDKGAKKPVTRWFHGQLELEASLPFVTRPEHASWLIKGKHKIILSEVDRREFDVFGRIQCPNYDPKTADPDSPFHLLWRGTHADDEHGAGSAVFTKQDMSSDSIVGVWFGRSSWVKSGECVPASGVFVFDTRGNRSVADLRKITKRFFDRYPQKATFERYEAADSIMGNCESME